MTARGSGNYDTLCSYVNSTYNSDGKHFWGLRHDEVTARVHPDPFICECTAAPVLGIVL